MECHQASGTSAGTGTLVNYTVVIPSHEEKEIIVLLYT